MAAASKRFGYARGEKVMKEIRGGLPEKDANNNVINLKQKIFILKGLRRWTKGYTIKQPNMDCQPTEITALMRHRAVFS